MFDAKRNINKPSGQTPPAKKPAHTTSPESLPETPAWPKASAENASIVGGTPLQGGGESSGSRGPEINSTSSLMKFLLN